ncbi:hypothetical protein G6F70_000736 [Rhizopus microsporus]|nr:hypothetical protein G6F71_007639 [Rhizopus microsporus]KAG1204165.1 hypothetical protein G6F70_000736 [Rhizopus microsporus]KAG1211082.1 hypothetical protein G6F69_004897 [Rhizopus microsporus]KAG1232942.1 hypothetical protein G6F67_004635 [Rhizopus microsporus]KAG1265020.1 hypothetical protein G6F68_003927 [Rhizopus microsporus]
MGLLASTDTQGRHFKDNLRQYNAAFAFTSLGCNIVSAKDRANNNNNNRGGLNAFQIYGALCHRHGPLTLVEGSEPSYVQLYIFDPSYAAERRQARNSNIDPETIMKLSAMFAQYNPFAHVYRHAHEILSNHESSGINSERKSNNNGSTESGSSYIRISPSMRMGLIEGGYRRTHYLPTMEQVVTVIPIEYIDRSFCDISLFLRGSKRSRSDSLRQRYEFVQYFQSISQAHTAYISRLMSYLVRTIRALVKQPNSKHVQKLAEYGYQHIYDGQATWPEDVTDIANR